MYTLIKYCVALLKPSRYWLGIYSGFRVRDIAPNSCFTNRRDICWVIIHNVWALEQCGLDK